MKTNEIFLLVGEVIAHILATFASNGEDLQIARQPYSDFVQEPWWYVALARTGSHTCASDSMALPDTLRRICEESSSLLRAALAPLAPELQNLMTVEAFGRVVGMFEQNNVGIRASSPVPALLETMSCAQEQEQGSALVDQVVMLVEELRNQVFHGFSKACGCRDSDCDVACSSSGKEVVRPHAGGVNSDVNESTFVEAGCTNLHQEAGCSSVSASMNAVISLQQTLAGDIASQMFTPLDGTALYSLICSMNHSCAPNCVVTYPTHHEHLQAGRAKPLLAQVALLQDVKAGEELTQSYVDLDMELDDRRDALQDYGFWCRCSRCAREEQSEAV